MSDTAIFPVRNFQNRPLPRGYPSIWPRITIVTAVYNGERYLDETIRSIMQQQYPNLEYIIVDDGSTDGTVEIIKRYEQHLTCWFSQPNRGLYAALNAGFAKSTGEIMGWLNSSDMLQVNGLFTVGSVFNELQELEWITGRPTAFSETSIPIFVADVRRWSRYRFLAGANKYIQQESTFWRRSLWQRAGGELSTEYRAEGDFELWVRFFRHARLYSINALVGGFRRHQDSLSHANIDRYNKTCDQIVARELESGHVSKWVTLFRRASLMAAQIPIVRWAWRQFIMQALYQCPGPDLPPFLEYRVDQGRWVIGE